MQKKKSVILCEKYRKARLKTFVFLQPRVIVDVVGVPNVVENVERKAVDIGAFDWLKWYRKW